MTVGALFAGAVCMAFGATVGIALATNMDASADAKWWDLMTAFGTVGAVVAAVGVALWQNRAMQGLRYREAELVLAEMYPRFSALRAACTLARNFFETAKTVDQSPLKMAETVSLLRREYLAAAVPAAVVLSPLGGNSATNAAVVNSHLQAIVRLEELNKWPTPDDRMESAVFIVRALDAVIPALEALGRSGERTLKRLASQ